MKNNLGFIAGGTTFVLFMTEAIIHFNMGQNYDKEQNGEKPLPFHLPTEALVIFPHLNNIDWEDMKPGFPPIG